MPSSDRCTRRLLAANLLIAVGLGAVAAVGCNSATAKSEPPQAQLATAPTAAGSGAGAGGSAAGTVKRPRYDSDNAWKLLLKQCDFGPRPVGSPAHDRCRAFLLDEMRKYADKTVAQDFTYKELPLTNIIGVFNPEAKRQVLLCAHWDTRPTADMEIEAADKKKPILGADDGASGVAVLLELAREFHEQKPRVGVVIVLLDGEDYGSFETMQGVLLGAKYLETHHAGYHPAYGVLLDMIANPDLHIYREPNSDTFTASTNDKFFSIAKELGYGQSLVDRTGPQITDDHIPISQGGIPTIDLIDFNYAYWHTLHDTPDHCSAVSMAKVGNTLAEMVYRED